MAMRLTPKEIEVKEEVRRGSELTFARDAQRTTLGRIVKANLLLVITARNWDTVSMSVSKRRMI